MKAAIEHSQATGAIGENVDEGLRTIQNQNQADTMRYGNIYKKADLTPQEETHIYDAREEKTTESLTPKEKEANDQIITPIKDEEARIISKLKDRGIQADDTHNSRIVMERGGFLDKVKQGMQSAKTGGGGLLTKTTGAMKRRVMMAVTDGEGMRQVVSIKNGLVTAWNDGKPTTLGVIKPPEQGVKEYYDKQIMEKLEKLASDLGIDYERVAKRVSGLGGNRMGVSFTGQNAIKTLAGTPEQVILHEIGHQLDARYGLQQMFVNNKEVKVELRNLADLKFQDTETSDYFKKYVRKGEEKIAAIFETYLHAPELFKQTAPILYQKFDEFLSSHPETKPIQEIKPSMVVQNRIIGGEAKVPNSFKDNTGKKWKIEQATTKEIEKNTNLKYSHYSLANELMTLQKLQSAERASDWVEQFKDDPEFGKIAMKVGTGNIPEGYKFVDAPQFRGYAFEADVADVINRFYANSGGDDGLLNLTKINMYVRNVSLFNPLYHGLVNVMPNWLHAKGVVGLLNPLHYPAEARGGINAFRALLNPLEAPSKGLPSYADLLDHNMTLTSSHAQSTLSDAIRKRLGTELQTNLSQWRQLADSLGWANPVKLADWLIGRKGISFKAAMMSEDMARLQIVYQGIENGMTTDQAVAQVDKIFPTNRISAGQEKVANKIVGTRIAGAIRNPNVTMFAGYHASLFQTVANDVKQLLGYIPEAGTKKEAADRIAALAIGLLALYPAYDAILKAVTKNPNAVAKRGGIFAVLYNIEQLLKSKENIATFTSGTFTPSPVTEALVETALNRDFFTGNEPIPQGTPVNPLTVAGAFNSELGGASSASQNASQIASGKKALSSYLYSLVGVSIPKSSPSLVTVEDMIYNQRTGLDSQIKAAVAAGDMVTANKIKDTYNKKLLDNLVDALIETKPQSGGLLSSMVRQVKIENEITGDTKALRQQLWTDPKLKADWLQLPSAKVMQTYDANQTKNNIQKLGL